MKFSVFLACVYIYCKLELGGGGASSDLDGGSWHSSVHGLDVPGEAVDCDAVVPAAVADIAGGAVVASLRHGLVALHHEPVPALHGVRLVLARAHARVVKIVCRHRIKRVCMHRT